MVFPFPCEASERVGDGVRGEPKSCCLGGGGRVLFMSEREITNRILRLIDSMISQARCVLWLDNQDTFPLDSYPAAILSEAHTVSLQRLY